MTKKMLMDLIKSHYENDPITFFNCTLEILKELKASGDDEIVKYLDFILKCNVKIAPKREVKPYNPEISFEEAEKLGWIFVPQGEDN